MKDVRKDSVPFDRLTEICGEMLTVLEDHGDPKLKGIAMVHDGEMGGIAMTGLLDENEAVAVMLTHLRAIFAAHGKSFQILTDNHLFDMGQMP